MNDSISRQAAIDVTSNDQLIINAMDSVEDGDMHKTKRAIQRLLASLPSAQPEYRLDEWCTDCKEYDKERNCCPRWNRVIRDTLRDVQSERRGKWVYEGVRGRFPVCSCSVCGNRENADWAVLGDNVNYCPNCGAKMEE